MGANDYGMRVCTKADVDALVLEMNKDYAAVWRGNRWDVARVQFPYHGGHPLFVPEQNFYDFETTLVAFYDEDGRVLKLPKARLWLRHHLQRIYFKIGFDPTTTDHIGMWNLFLGWKYDPVEGDVTPWIDFVRMLSAGDEKQMRAVIRWVARIFQKPQVEQRQALVIEGSEGSGKGIFCSVLSRLLGVHCAMHEASYRGFATRVGYALEGKLLTVLDEFDLTPQKAQFVKRIIDSPQATISHKYSGMLDTTKLLRVIVQATSGMNHLKGSNVLIWKVSGEKACDHSYFEPLCEWLAEGGYAKVLNYLLTVDLDNPSLVYEPPAAPLGSFE